MSEFQVYRLPHGTNSIEFNLPKDKVQAVLCPKSLETSLSEEEVIIDALKTPVASLPLREMVKGKRHILIITSDNTRPATSKKVFPFLIEEIKKGNSKAKITVLIATGLHTELSIEELREKFTGDILNNIDIVTHDAYNDLVFLGKLSTGTELWVNKLILEADLIISEGIIEPHFFAGFTGGRKSILPGISGFKTIFSNHSARRIDHPLSRNGILEGNPIHMEMCEAAYKAKLSFIFNSILDGSKRIVKAFCGDPFKAHKSGVAFIKEYISLPPSYADIVVTSNSGYPLDRNIYQLVKGISVASETTKPGGIIIIVAECKDGIGHNDFYKLLSESSSPTELLEHIRRGESLFKDQWQAQILAKILEKYVVILVSDRIDHRIVENMHMLYASSIQEALDKAFSLKGNKSKVVILPEGPKTIIKREA